MKYFTYELIAAANGWDQQGDAARVAADERFWATVEAYFAELESLRPRLSRAAFEFFRHGYGPTGLHDANLLSLAAGDGLNYVADGSTPLYVNRKRAAARVEFLNYEQNLLHNFELRGLRSLRCDLFVEDDEDVRRFGDLYTYELTGDGEGWLRLGFVFASGSTAVFSFRRLVYRRRRLAKAYGDLEIYK
jgi:hypothetical protein